jgi:outer membrane receptor protein involved in Fe transport
MKKSSIFKASVAPAVLGMAMISAPAYAQDQDAEAAAADNSVIVVTGSRIQNPNIELSSPVNVISEDEITYRQPASIEEVLRQLPGTVPGIGSAVNNGTGGTATFNLRGLGSNRNLVLLNGRRIVPSGTGGVTDLNLIPTALLQRVEVLTGGASSIYGADAITGVANFVTREDFSGFQLDTNFGITERGDGQQFRTDLTIGANFDDGRGNAVFSIGYTDTDAVLQGDRDVSLVSFSSATGNPQGSPTSAPASILFPLEGVFDPASGTIDDSQLGDFNFNPLNVFQTPFERFNIFGQAQYEVADNIEVYIQGFYTRNQVQQRIAPSGTFFNDFNVPLNNPFLTPAQALQLCTAAVGITGGLPAGTDCTAAIAAGTEVATQIGRRFVEFGPRLTTFVSQSFQLTAGARGKLTDTINWNVSGQYGEASFVNTSEGQGIAPRVQQALRATNTTTCTVTSGGCVPINIFGAPGTLSQEALNFINVPTFAFANSSLATVDAGLEGDFGYASPFATTPISFAVGGEFREFAASSRGDGLSSTPNTVLGQGAAALPVDGSYNSYEAYIEVVAPLVEDRPFFHSLTVEGGYRYSDYNTIGGTDTYKFGGSWAPIEDIKFRAVFSRSVRAPNVGELFSPQVTGLSNLTTDPCQGTAAEVAARGANFPALCQAQVVGTQFGSIPAPAAGQINVTGGGNPDLDAESADSFTAGVVISPSFVPGLTLTVDYFDIDIVDAISSPSAATVLGSCFSTTNTNPNLPECQLIRRNTLTGGLSGPSSTTLGVLTASSNLGVIETNGIDAALTYQRDVGFAEFSLVSSLTYTIDNLFQANSASINRECVGFYSVSCGNPQPEWQWNVRAGLTFDDTDVSLLWRHLSSVEVEPVAPNPQLPLGTPTTAGPATVFAAFREIPAFDYFDLSLRQAIGENFQLTISVLNLFDKDPPNVGNTIGGTGPNSGNTFPSVYDALGRRYTVGLRLKF